MKITNSVNFTKKCLHQKKFNNASSQTAMPPIDCKLSLKSLGLIRRADDYLEDAWTAIRKGALKMKEPYFVTILKNNDVVTLRPIYNGRKSMLLEISNNKYVENIIIDREKQNNFTYEKRVITDHGSATLKSFNSKINNNKLQEDIINNKIEEGLSAILQKLSIRELLKR